MPQPLIDASTHCPICGSARYVRVDRTRRCEACGHRDFNNPIAAVAVWILDSEGKVLLIERAKDPACGKLAPPGGFVDPGESLEAAARREVREEVGLRLSSLRYLCSAPNAYTYRGLTRPVCDAFFLGRATHGDITEERAEVRRALWLPRASINPETLAFDSMRAAWRKLLDEPET